MLKTAIFSDDRKYRYLLTRIWDQEKPRVLCIGLNPSTANEAEDDTTITNLSELLKQMGFGGLYMGNLYAFISTDPDKLSEQPDPVGKINDITLKWAAEQSSTVIFCWGNFKQALWRAKKVIDLFPDAHCFGKSKSGAPMHPLAATIWMRTKVNYQRFRS